MNAETRLKLLRSDRDGAGRVEPSRSPAERLLLQFRAWKQAAYVCDPQRAGRWHADCPVWGRKRSVTITELVEDGPIVMACATRCGRQAIRETLDRIGQADPASEWRSIALEARAILHRQADLIDRLLGRDDSTGGEAA